MDDERFNAVSPAFQAELRTVLRIGLFSLAPHSNDLDERGAWYPYAPAEPNTTPLPQIADEHENWSWFSFAEVAYLDGLVLLEFKWMDPSTPKLRYIVSINVDPEWSVSVIASCVQSYLRNLLTTGWRDRVEPIWLGRDRVFLQKSSRHVGLLQFARQQQWNGK